MQPFTYRRASDENDAVAMATAQPGAAFVAGGTDFMQLWKAGVGALARMSDVADHALVRDEFPVIAEALLASASPQVRNVATIGGNLLQRTRCAYFRGAALPCNKRLPGSGCGALEGENRLHAIFGASDPCAATHPSDLAVALVALGATIRLRGGGGERVLPVEDFYRLPGEHPERETVLGDGELIVEIEVPRSAAAGRSHYLKVRDRASFEFAVVSAAVAVDVEDGLIRAAQIAAGGVGTKPWRLQACEASLAGARLDEAAFRQAAELAATGARPLSGNGFKIALLKRTVLRALKDVGEMA